MVGITSGKTKKDKKHDLHWYDRNSYQYPKLVGLNRKVQDIALLTSCACNINVLIIVLSMPLQAKSMARIKCAKLLPTPVPASTAK